LNIFSISNTIYNLDISKDDRYVVIGSKNMVAIWDIVLNTIKEFSSFVDGNAF
jgi:hypothetical protein